MCLIKSSLILVAVTLSLVLLRLLYVHSLIVTVLDSVTQGDESKSRPQRKCGLELERVVITIERRTQRT